MEAAAVLLSPPDPDEVEEARKRLNFSAVNTPSTSGTIDLRPSPSPKPQRRLSEPHSPHLSPLPHIAPAVFCVPLDAEDREERSRGITPSYQAPRGEDDDGHAEPEPPGSGHIEISPSGAVEDSLRQLQAQWHNFIQRTQVERRSSLQRALQDAEQQLAQQLAALATQIQRKESELASHDGAARQQARSARDRSLRELQQSHEKQAALQQLHVDRLTQQAAQAQEAARRVQEEAARQEQERRRQKAEAEERAKQEAAVAAAAAEAARKAEAAAAAAATAARPTEAAASAAAPSAGPAAAAVSTSAAGVRDPHEAASIIAPGARELEQRCAAKLREAKALVAPLQGDEWKKMRRDLEKKINVHLQQVAGTQEQVRRKSADVAAMLRDCPAETWRTYAMLVFAGKLMKQCESQVSLQTKSAYPLAAVVVRVSHHFPQLMDLVLATLHDACPLTLPKMYSRKALQPGAYFRLMRYREVESDEGGGGGSGPAKRVVESDDAYIERMAGYVALYAAITQDDFPQNCHAIPYAWSYCSRLLNYLCNPPTRLSAKALYFFLRTAVYGMHVRYRGQLDKLLRVVYEGLLPELRRASDADVQAVVVQLDTLLSQGAYRREPEGRAMPETDLSTQQGLSDY